FERTEAAASGLALSWISFAIQGAMVSDLSKQRAAEASMNLTKPAGAYKRLLKEAAQVPAVERPSLEELQSQVKLQLEMSPYSKVPCPLPSGLALANGHFAP
ncbi:unnamed protein product, partial [Effrenium voratum]